MARELKNVEVQFVSYVDKAANKKKFFLLKSEEDIQPDFEKEVRILTKENDPKKLVYGVVYAPDEIDSQGDMMNAEEIEKACHGFMKNFQKIDEQHNFTEGAGALVECSCQLADIEVGGETITKGTWTIVTEATDEIWEKIEKGIYTGYSLAGIAGKLIDKKEKKFTDVMLKYANRDMEIILKDFNSSMEEMKNNDLFAPMDVLWKAIWDARWENEDHSAFKKAVKKVCSQFYDYINKMSFETIKKEEAQIQEGDEEMDEKQTQEMIDKALEPIVKALGLEKDQTLSDVIQKAIGEIEPSTPIVKDAEGKEINIVEMAKSVATMVEKNTAYDETIEAMKVYMTGNPEQGRVVVEDKPVEKSDAAKKANLAL